MRINDFFGGSRTIYFHLYRRVVEIRDAILILRDYVKPELLEQARQYVTEHGLPEDQIEPVIIACWLAVACQAKVQGVSPYPNSFAFVARQREGPFQRSRLLA